ncbi:Transmembrane anterior posterior transformation protein 1 [Blomia tropicalis]|nr:Transmembrane anterior posterior transformation protein 1 [Blomia tropicalis]
MRNEKSTIENGPSLTPKTNSFFDFVRCELRRGYVLQNDEQRYRERRDKFYVSLQIPLKLETFLFYGFFQCVDAFLFVLTFLPFRFLLAILLLWIRLFKLFLRSCSSFSRVQAFTILNPAETCDILKGFVIICCVYLMNNVDTSMIYHIIKSQSVIKLYIFFNMLEVADKLLSSFGQDILDALYWTATEPKTKKRQSLKFIFHFVFAILYVFAHSILVLLQATTLNVAINSKNKALLTVMMSNNFVELKSMVFKKFEKNNLFHMSCSDVRERFHYIILLLVVIVQTMKEYSWSEKQFWILLPDCLWVLVAEMFVDYFKHAFVTRFNDIPYDVYEDYSISLAYDLVGSKLKSAFSDHSDIISRRMGFIPLPLSVLVIRIFFGSFAFNDQYSCLCLLISFKLAINIVLLGLSCNLIDEHRKNLDDKVNKAIGGQSASLPASRHNSVTDLTILDEEEKLIEIKDRIIEQTPSKQPKIGSGTGTRSTPHSPTASLHNSLEDITEQAAIRQDTLEPTIILSDSTVRPFFHYCPNLRFRAAKLFQLTALSYDFGHLVSMNDGQSVKLPENILMQKENIHKVKNKLNSPRKRFFQMNSIHNLMRRVSLQELPNNVPQTAYEDQKLDDNTNNKMKAS